MSDELRILLVEDDDAHALLVELALEKAGVTARLERVMDGDGALEVLLATESDPVGWRPEVVLLDLCMPKMGGEEVLKSLRATRAMDDTAIVILTTSCLEDQRAEMLALGADAYLMKPVLFDEFVDLLRRTDLPGLASRRAARTGERTHEACG